MSNDRGAVLARLGEVFQDIFDDDGLVISEATTAKDIPEWDSLMHISLCVAIERVFGTQLNAVEVGNLKNVGEMVDLLQGQG